MAAMLAGLAGSAMAQDAETDTKPPGRVSFGLRIRVLPIRALSVMSDRQSMTTTVAGGTTYDWHFNTTSGSSMLGFGPAFEFDLGKKTMLTAEVLFDRLRYNKVTDTYYGSDDPTTGTDERSHVTATERTQARLWDVPLILHRGGFRESGVLSHLFVAGGVTARLATTVRTTNDITYADGTLGNNSDRAQLSKSTLLGFVTGVGFRFIDDFNIKVVPEIRYTRWLGSTFGTDSTLSPRNQLEIGLMLTH